MTRVTLIRGINVGSRCFTRGNHAVMTTLTGTHGLVVIHRGGWYPRGKGMTGCTHIAGANMGRIFIAGDGAVVTIFTHTDSGDFIMIHRTRGYPDRIDVTGFADIRRTDMRCRLSTRGHTIVTSNTGVGRRGVIKHGYGPIHGGVADIAGRRRDHMRCTHAGGDHTVMTSGTNAIDLRVIHRGYRRPTDRRVTGITLIRGIDMRAGCFTRGNHAIVATLTGALHFVVIHGAHWHPGRWDMTTVADVAGIDVGCGFVGSDHTIVTRLANRHVIDFSMIHRTRGHPGNINVTGLTEIAGIDMSCRLAPGRGAIVTGDAGIGGSRMIKDRHRPVHRGVTDLAGLGGRHVSR